MAKVISMATGFSATEIGDLYKQLGDFGLVAEKLCGKKRQKTLFQVPLTIDKVFENIRRLASVEGKGSQDTKFRMVSELISSARPKESKYIVRTVLGDLRVGVAEGVVRDSIVMAFISKGRPLKECRDGTNAVEWAWFLRPDYGEVALIARRDGMEGLKKVRLKPGSPYHVLLAEKSPGLEEALQAFRNPSLEYKYDGARIIIHKKGDRVWLYTRRLENVTKQFPELKPLVMKAVRARDCIMEGEMLGIDRKTGDPMPFQLLSQRIKRKYDIERMVKEIPIQVNLFDIVYLNGRELFNRPLSERRKLLEETVEPVPKKFQMARMIVTKDLKQARAFYEEALDARQEGLIVKNLDADYQPGRRVGYWLKVKPIMETLDLTITGALWGTGKRAGVLSSFILACRTDEGFADCGMMGTGIKEKPEEGLSFEQLTEMLKPGITGETKEGVKIKPSMVVEVAYEEIQKSPTYSSGFALRFPRIVKVRPDKGPQEADDIDRVKALFSAQFKRQEPA
jgi:DNA ligase-1